MIQLPSEILLSVLKRIDSREMVKFTRVSKEWLEIIGENKALWRRVVLPKREGGWELSTLQFFDERTNSTLKEVSMELESLETNLDGFMKVLEKSKGHLRTICLYNRNFDLSPSDEESLLDLSLRLSQLSSFRIINSQPNRLVHLRSRKDYRNSGAAANFKILWGFQYGSISKLVDLAPHRLENLISLQIESFMDYRELNAILRHCSKTLKQHEIKLARLLDVNLPRVDLPCLEVLDINALDINTQSHKFPSWLTIPSSSTLAIRVDFFPDTPAVSKLWLHGLEAISQLGNTFPGLKEIRISTIYSDIGNDRRDESNWRILLRDKTNWQKLLEVLRHRRNISNFVRASGGTSRLHIKKLVIPFKLLDDKKLSELEGLKDELVDLDNTLRYVEVEV